MGSLVTLALIVSGAAAVLGLGAARYAQRAASLAATSAPKRLEEGLAAVLERVSAVEAEMEGHRGALLRAREEVSSMIDVVEETLERTEQKRRRIAASNSRRAEPEIDPNSREGLVQLAKARGFEVA